MLLTQLALGSAMIVATAIVHTSGLVAIIVFLTRRTALVDPHRHVGRRRIARFLALTVLVVFLLHSVEIWVWAVLYQVLGEFEEFSRALYFSTVVFTTLGFGDVVLSPRWQLLSAMEAANGIILFGLSTALLFAIFVRLIQTADLVEPSQ
ncbi:MAG: ion channel [Proteobacteria bacterium]|nr:ion channel [Pseudomonadota bacterium]